MIKLEVRISYGLNSFYHSAGNKPSFGIDNPLYLHPTGDETPAIPGSSIKGVFRHWVESVLRARGGRVCEAPRPEKMCRREDDCCIVCRFFGSPRIPSKLFFEDSKIENYAKSSRVGVGIDRRKRTAKEDLLFTHETSLGEEFTASITGLFRTVDEALTASALLFLGAKATSVIGGCGSRGMGWIEVREFRATINGKEIDKGELKEKLREVLKL